MKYFTLDLCRGFAALWVFAHHFRWSDEFTETLPAVKRSFEQGGLGVSIFFVISGYCIISAARRAIAKDTRTTIFTWRRLRRIYPPMWFSILLFVALPFLMELLSFAKTGHYVAPKLEQLQFWHFDFWQWFRLASLSEIFFSSNGLATNLTGKFSHFNAPYWSLAIEVQFYLVVALGLLISRKYFLTTMLAVTVISFASISLGLPRDIGLFLNHWPSFAYGGLVALLVEKNIVCSTNHGAKTKCCSTVIGLVALAIPAGLIVTGRGISGHMMALAFAVALWCLRPLDVAIYENQKTKKGISFISAASFLGVISYSIYLLHCKLVVIADQISRQILPENTIVYDVSVFAVTCLLCVPFYYLCEKPFASSAKKKEQQELSALATD